MPGVIHPGHLRVLGQEPRDRHRVLAVPLHAQRQCLQPLQEHEGIERAHRGADIAQELNAQLDDVGDVGAEVLGGEDVAVDQAVVAADPAW